MTKSERTKKNEKKKVPTTSLRSKVDDQKKLFDDVDKSMTQSKQTKKKKKKT